MNLRAFNYRRLELNYFGQTSKINSCKTFYLEPSAKFNSHETYFFSHPQNLIPAKFKNEARQPRNLIPAKISSFKVEPPFTVTV